MADANQSAELVTSLDCTSHASSEDMDPLKRGYPNGVPSTYLQIVRDLIAGIAGLAARNRGLLGDIPVKDQ